MASRIEIHEILCDVLGSRHVYYQPPETVKIEYPAIIYSRKKIQNNFADNSVYMQTPVYEVTVIDKDPDSEIVKKLSELPACRHDRYFKSENLNHDTFTFTLY